MGNENDCGIEPCQYCGASPELIGTISATDVSSRGSIDHWLFCRKCKGSGPIEPTRDLAVRAWSLGKEIA